MGGFDANTMRLVFVAGKFSLPLSSQPAELEGAGVTLSGSVDGGSALEAAVIHLGRETSAEGLLNIVHLFPEGEGNVCCPSQLYLEVGRGAGVTVVETVLCAEQTAYNVTSKLNVKLKEDAALTAYMVRATAGGSSFDSALDLKIEGRARAAIHLVSSGGSACHAGMQVSLCGEGARFAIAALGLVTRGMQLDTKIDVWHQAPHTTSRQLFKSIVADHGKSAFAGNVHVASNAAKTDAYQLNRTMLLDPTAHSVVKPQLYIDNADVKCSHGAASGRVREEEMFYLESRGIPQAWARRMLCRAFAGEITGGFREKASAARVERMLGAALCM